MKEIINKSIKDSISYNEYKELFSQYSKNNDTSGTDKSEERIGFTKLNFSRTKRLDKTTKLSGNIITEISKINQKQTWMVLTETWCGDAAQTLPVLDKLSQINENIELKVVFRDENTDLMNLFLTNNSMSIPKLIILDQNNELIDSWGPRSKKAAKLVTDYKAKYGKIDATIKENLQLFYNQDKGESVINEVIDIVVPVVNYI
ncbi:MAG: thioredoxin family protein [Flavobacteriaceae bacterium]|nr:thioredoxin family protein [Flavobacteriaceae bacterium]